jgi:hypothetical protein
MYLYKSFKLNLRGLKMEKLYKEHGHIIKKMATQISKRSGIEREELECQGNLIFCECVSRYDQNKGEFSHYLTTTLHFELFKYARELNSDNSEEFNPEFSPTYTFTPEKITIAAITLENMSRDARTVTKLVLNPEYIFPEEKELFRERKNRDSHEVKVHKKAIKNHLKAMQWTRSRIDRTFNEIAMAIQ